MDPNDRARCAVPTEGKRRFGHGEDQQGIAQLGECRTRTAEAAGAGPATLTNIGDVNDRAFLRPGLELGIGLGHG